MRARGLSILAPELQAGSARSFDRGASIATHVATGPEPFNLKTATAPGIRRAHVAYRHRLIEQLAALTELR
jgi:hypothetical protein